MDLKFYLNKFLKIDNIEGYTLNSLNELKKCYDKFLKNSEGTDPDFPTLNFGGKGDTYTAKNNIVRRKVEEEQSEEF